MHKKTIWKKGLVLNIILLLITITVVPSINGNINTTVKSDGVTDIRYSSIIVNITHPKNGIYCNNMKILPFFVPLILYGEIIIVIQVEGVYGSDRVDIYINGDLVCTITEPPYKWIGALGGNPFSRLKWKVDAYISNGEYGSAEIVIWRIFS